MDTIKNSNLAVLLIIFNKPKETEIILNSLLQAKVQNLYVLCDGYRNQVQGEFDLVNQTRNIINKYKSNFKLHELFLNDNIGIKNTFYKGLNWFFEFEEMGIILESDCLPNKDFFIFCETMLIKYKDDHRIWHISGTNFRRGKSLGGDYFFTSIPLIWGWATWKRAWQHYDPLMTDYPVMIKKSEFRNSFFSKKEFTVWKKIFTKTYEGKIQTWDYQWTYAIKKNNALAINPNANLVSNIGFGKNAINTKDIFSHLSNVPLESMEKIEHPLNIIKDIKADKFIFYNNICGRYCIISILIRIYFHLVNRFQFYGFKKNV